MLHILLASFFPELLILRRCFGTPKDICAAVLHADAFTIWLDSYHLNTEIHLPPTRLDATYGVFTCFHMSLPDWIWLNVLLILWGFGHAWFCREPSYSTCPLAKNFKLMQDDTNTQCHPFRHKAWCSQHLCHRSVFGFLWHCQGLWLLGRWKGRHGRHGRHVQRLDTSGYHQDVPMWYHSLATPKWQSDRPTWYTKFTRIGWHCLCRRISTSHHIPTVKTLWLEGLGDKTRQIAFLHRALDLQSATPDHLNCLDQWVFVTSRVKFPWMMSCWQASVVGGEGDCVTWSKRQRRCWSWTAIGIACRRVGPRVPIDLDLGDRIGR